MKIAIICDPIDLKYKTGISVYCENLINNLITLDQKNEYIFIHTKENELLKSKNNIILKNKYNNKFIYLAYMIWRKFFLIPYYLRKNKIDIVHELNVINPGIFDIFRKYKTITTIFDLTPVIYPELHGFLNNLGFKLFTKLSIKSSKKIISISQATKNDIIKYFGIENNKIDTILLGTNISKRKEDNSIHFDFPFILSVGTLEPRKNLRLLVKSFVKLKEEKNIKEKLILVGKKGWKIEGLFEELNLNKNFKDDIILTGFITDEQLVHLYKTAKVFVYPSLYEGFGLPVLEAMTLGVPVITSDISSLPEVTGKKGILINPNSIEDLSEKLYSLLIDEKLRDENRKYGLEESLKFSWEKCARETIKVYEDLYKK